MLKPKLFKARQLVGKYRIQKRIANGPLAAVYQAFDTVLCRRVALKIPHAGLDPFILEDFRKEARLAVRLEHPNILPVFNASFIDSRFVIVTPLGEQTLADRLVKRMATTNWLRMGTPPDRSIMVRRVRRRRPMINCRWSQRPCCDPQNSV